MKENINKKRKYLTIAQLGDKMENALIVAD